MKDIQRVLLLACLGLLLGAGQAGAVYHKHTIHGIRTGGVALGDSCQVDSVRVIGIDVKPSTYGVYLEEPAGGPNSGILAYRGGVFPKYDNNQAVSVGDLLTVKGIYAEFASGLGSLSELNNPILTLISHSGSAPAAQAVTVTQIRHNDPLAEQWEGVLVKVSNVKVTYLNTFNNWYFHQLPCGPCAGTDSLNGYEKMVSGQVVPVLGDTLLQVTGVAEWENQQRCIAPRNNDDIKFKHLPAPAPNYAYSSAETKVKVHFNVTLDKTSAQTVGHYSLSTFETIDSAAYDSLTDMVTLTTHTALVPSTTPHVLTVGGVLNFQGRLMTAQVALTFVGGISTIAFVQTPKSATNDTSQVVNRIVSIRGVVTEKTGPYSAADSDFPETIGGFYVQQRNASEYAGLFVFGVATLPSRGDSVLVAGLITEFGVGPETELQSVRELTVLGTGRPPIQPLAVTLADINGTNKTQYEKYESSLVKVLGGTIITQGVFQGDPFDIVTGTDTLRVDDLAVNESAFGPAPGRVVDVIGINRVSGSLPYFRLQPRDWREPPRGDIHVVSIPVATPPSAYRTELLQNEPNPFNPSTEIAFTLAQPGRVKLGIFDVAGRLVATLLDGKAKAGRNHVLWAGTNDAGRRVDTGVYFYRLWTADQVMTRKMVLIK